MSSVAFVKDPKRALQDALGENFRVYCSGWDDGPPPRYCILRRVEVPFLKFWTKTKWPEMAYIDQHNPGEILVRDATLAMELQDKIRATELEYIIKLV